MICNLEPVIAPAAPVLNNPTQITTQKRLMTSGSFSNRTSAIKMPYVAKDGADIPEITISDHNLDGCAGVVRVQNGHIGKLTVERISMLNGKYSSGVGCGLVLVSGADLDEIIIRDCDYNRSEYITASGDIYAGSLTGGGHNGTGNVYGSCKKFTIERVRARNMFTNYAGTDYPNSDGLAVEKTFLGGLVKDCDFRFGADAGIDCKGELRVQGTVIEGFRENFKTWVSRQDGDVYSRSPRFAHWLITQMNDVPDVTEHTVEFAEVVSTDPTAPVVKFEHGPGILRLLNSVIYAPEGQILAKADREAFGSKVIIGDRVIEVSQPAVML